MNVLVCFALKEEAAPFRKLAAGRPGVTILLTGIGKKNAGRAIRNFLTSGAGVPDAVLTCGFAGALNPRLPHGEVLFDISPVEPPAPAGADAVKDSPSPGGEGRGEGGRPANHSQTTGANEALCQKLTAAGAKPAKFFCADRIAVTAREKHALWQQTAADAVEMESQIIRALCREHGIPSATVRVISDIAGEDLPLDFNALAKPDQNLDFGKLLLAIARSPGKIPALLRLQKQTAAAAQKLAAVLDSVL